MRDVTRLFLNKHFGNVPDDIMDTFIEMYISEWNSGIILYPEMQSFLRRLKKRYSLSIISNTHYPSLVHRNLKAMGVEGYFDLVVTSVEYGIPKPDPRIFHHTLSSLSAKAENTVHIGDSFNDDYRGALDAGIKCILLDPDQKRDGAEGDKIASIFEIEKLLK